MGSFDSWALIAQARQWDGGGPVVGSGGKRVARPRAEGLGELVDVLSYDRAKAERIAAALGPCAFSLLFELCSIVAFGYGLAETAARLHRAAALMPVLPLLPQVQP